MSRLEPDPGFAARLARVPKADLHCHLVGALRASTVLELGHAAGMSLPGKTPENLYRYGDFYEFIEVYRYCSRVLRTSRDFERAVFEAAEDELRHGNVVHLELAFNPSDFLSTGVAYRTLADGLVSGARAARRDLGVSVLLIAALDREGSAQLAIETVQAVIEGPREEIVGIGLDYAENKGPPANFRAAFELAGRRGLRRTAHVCEDYLTPEQAPPSNVSDCLDVLGCDRLDHGYNLLASPEVTERVCSERIPLTCCVVTSDVRRNARRLETIRGMVEAGLNVTINTDDPQMFRTSPEHCWQTLFAAHGWGWNEARQFALAGAEASWLPESEKRTLGDRVREELHRLEAEMPAG